MARARRPLLQQSLSPPDPAHDPEEPLGSSTIPIEPGRAPEFLYDSEEMTAEQFDAAVLGQLRRLMGGGEGPDRR
jgi:hypothetical protein